MRLGRIKLVRKTGAESFTDGPDSLPMTLKDFWAWNTSDVVSNATRGALAEFIVGTVLNATGIEDGVREEWAAFDLNDPRGIPIEVKSAAYVQSWAQKDYSTITFSCPATLNWDADTNLQSEEKSRQADVYVFALLANKDQGTLDPLDVSQWEFFVVPTVILDRRKRSQSSITLKSLRELHGDPVKYSDLKDAVGKAAQFHNTLLKSKGSS